VIAAIVKPNMGLTANRPPRHAIVTVLGPTGSGKSALALDVAEGFRRKGVGTMLLAEMERHFAFKGVQSVLLETSVENESGIAFWERHGYRTEAVVKKYYLGKIDAYEMTKKIEIQK